MPCSQTNCSYAHFSCTSGVVTSQNCFPPSLVTRMSGKCIFSRPSMPRYCARVFGKAYDFRLTVEEPECVELVAGLPMNHSPHLETRLLPRGAGIRPRDHAARSKLTRFRK